MPRYYFDIHDGDGHFIDEDGQELADIDHAIDLGRKTLAGLIKDELHRKAIDTVAIVIRDGADGPILMRLTLETNSFAPEDPKASE